MEMDEVGGKREGGMGTFHDRDASRPLAVAVLKFESPKPERHHRHDSEPQEIAKSVADLCPLSLYANVYNYETGALVKTFEVAEIPVRCV